MPGNSKLTWFMPRPVSVDALSLPFVTPIRVEEGSRAAALYYGIHATGRPYGDKAPSILSISSGHPEADDTPKLRDIFFAGGFLVLSERAADLVRDFDLGSSELSPIQLLKSDRKTPFSGSWVFFNITNLKNGFEPEHSTNFLPPRFETDKFLGRIKSDAKDGDIKVNSMVLQGPDIWRDPSLNFAIFVSDRLGKALQGSGFLNEMRLTSSEILV